MCLQIVKRIGQTNEWTACFLRRPLVGLANAQLNKLQFLLFSSLFYSLSYNLSFYIIPPLFFPSYLLISSFPIRQCAHHACWDLWLRRQTRVDWRQTRPHQETAHRSYRYQIWTATYFSFGSQFEHQRWDYAQILHEWVLPCDKIWCWYWHARLNPGHFKMSDRQKNRWISKANFLVINRYSPLVIVFNIWSRGTSGITYQDRVDQL